MRVSIIITPDDDYFHGKFYFPVIRFFLSTVRRVTPISEVLVDLLRLSLYEGDARAVAAKKKRSAKSPQERFLNYSQGFPMKRSRCLRPQAHRMKMGDISLLNQVIQILLQSDPYIIMINAAAPDGTPPRRF
jgi:hypothetical protein